MSAVNAHAAIGDFGYYLAVPGRTQEGPEQNAHNRMVGYFQVLELHTQNQGRHDLLAYDFYDV